MANTEQSVPVEQHIAL